MKDIWGLETSGHDNQNDLIRNSAMQYLGDSNLTPASTWELNVWKCNRRWCSERELGLRELQESSQGRNTRKSICALKV